MYTTVYSGSQGYLDYANDLSVLACTQAQIRDKTDKVLDTARRVELEIKGGLISVGRPSVYIIRTKLHLYNSIVKSVLLYGSECWQVVEIDFYKIEAFHNGCLHKIYQIFWPRTISNLELHVKTNSEPIQTKIKKRRLRWRGHILRISHNRIPRIALRWAAQGKRKQGIPKATWRRTVDKKIKAMGLTWGEAKMVGSRKRRPHDQCRAKSKKKKSTVVYKFKKN